MKGICLQIFVHENQKHQDMLAYEWILKKAQQLQISGGTAFSSIASFGRHGIMHTEHFFEIPKDNSIAVIFFLTEEKCEEFLQVLKKSDISFFHCKWQAEFEKNG
ncbi:MAG: hypothetical protein Tsb0015_03100 [Simkaniaceae bacterium]